MIKNWEVRSDHQRGAQLVEMALVLFLLLMLLLGMANLGPAFHDYIAITNAAREGARYASRFPQTQYEAEIKNATIQEALAGGLTIAPANIMITCPDRTSGQPITVEVKYSFHTILGAGNLEMHSATTMVII